MAYPQQHLKPEKRPMDDEHSDFDSTLPERPENFHGSMPRLWNPMHQFVTYPTGVSVPVEHQFNFNDHHDLPIPQQQPPANDTAYVYPSELIGHPGTFLPERNAFSTPTPEFTIPGSQRTPSGSTVVEPSVVYDETGRSYQAFREGKYFLPNDGDEQDRLDFQYEGFSILMDRKLFLAPLTRVPEHVIDVATGTGIWAVDFAKAFPYTHVVGTDLSAIQPTNKPDNCEFFKEDSEEPWVYDFKFDYVHLRMVFTCFDNPKRIIENAYHHMKPGAWIEFQDGSAEISSFSETFEGTALQQWGVGLINGAAAMGRDIQKGKKWRQWLIEAGFVDVEEHPVQFPVSGWPDDPKFKLAGSYMARNISDNLKGLSWKMLGGMGMAPDEIESFLERVKVDVLTRSLKAYLHFFVVYGRKPFDGEVVPASQ
ncbi:hypothetical protein JX265_012969 [Neoarthrinium moseri]|uniref:S-adenosyl-L-methionine-dependent methyltransferase n=1 Tax=Neoarthrinium moseri TaxID=1658444 RepID=A0A9Q0AI56_9PEZI|nr:hypothetical protein JX266_013020 [Neoarthrinium moseri]KAI1852941.1 hypothetical protein JX265_012969 [Neoarthrinium moseri]